MGEHRKCLGDDSSPGYFLPMPSERLRAQPFTERKNGPGARGLSLVPQIRAIGIKGNTGGHSLAH